MESGRIGALHETQELSRNWRFVTELSIFQFLGKTRFPQVGRFLCVKSVVSLVLAPVVGENA
jgi:hypothetical protein